jgi:hypothetical protein
VFVDDERLGDDGADAHARSRPVPFFTAATIPSGKARASETLMAKAARRSELGSRSPINSLTGAGRGATCRNLRSPPGHERHVLLEVGSIQAEIAAGVGVILLRGRHRQDQRERIPGRARQRDTTTDRIARAASD